jgi:hypothetical protein
MKKRILISILACLALVLVAPGAWAQTGEEVVINPVRWDSSQTVYTDQTVVFAVGWAACHYGNVRSFLTADNLVFTLDGEALFASQAQVDQYWGAINEIPAPPIALEACMGNIHDTIWRAEWAYEYGALAAGDHSLRFMIVLDHPVTDGADYDGDGGPDLFWGVVSDRTITIHVEER